MHHFNEEGSDMDNLFTFNEIGITYTNRGMGPKIETSRDVFDLLLPNWLELDYIESFHMGWQMFLNKGTHFTCY